MSVEHSVPIPVKEGDPIFLSVKVGMFVIVQHRPEVGQRHEEDSWCGWHKSSMLMEEHETRKFQRCSKWQMWMTDLSSG